MINKTNIPFKKHWKDLQIKIFYIIGSYSLTFLICFQYKINLFYFISSYFVLLKKTFIFTHLSSGFWAYLQLVFWTSVFFVIPVIIYFLFFFFLKSLFNFQIKIITVIISLLFFVSDCKPFKNVKSEVWDSTWFYFVDWRY